MHTTVLLGTRKCHQSAWRMASNQRFLSSLDHENPWEKSEGLALSRLKKRGTQQWSLNDIPKQKKNESSNEKHPHVHNAAESRLRCPEPRSRAIIVQMVYWKGKDPCRCSASCFSFPDMLPVMASCSLTLSGPGHLIVSGIFELWAWASWERILRKDIRAGETWLWGRWAKRHG